MIFGLMADDDKMITKFGLDEVLLKKYNDCLKCDQAVNWNVEPNLPSKNSPSRSEYGILFC